MYFVNIDITYIYSMFIYFMRLPKISVDGTWSHWTPWSLCSKTCGHQEEVRTRVCERQRSGGSYCSGHDIEIMPCNDYDYIQCPGKFGFRSASTIGDLEILFPLNAMIVHNSRVTSPSVSL